MITSIFIAIVKKIIQEQELVIGPLAWDQASKVQGLKIIDKSKGEVEFIGDPKTIIDKLVNQYEQLFGRASHEVCREAVTALIADLPASDIPSSLK